MRVLQVYRDYFTRMPGGIERHVRDLATGLVGRAEVEVLASSGSSQAHSFLDEGARVHLVREVARPAGVPIWRGARRVIGRGFDLFHLHSPNPTGELTLTRSRSDRPLVVTHHADVYRAPWATAAYLPLLRRTLQRADRIVVSTLAFAQRSKMVAPILDSDPQRVEVIPFGVDVERFAPGETSRSRSLRAAWGGGPSVLFVGRLRRYKGLLDLIRAVAGSDMTLVVAGDGPGRDEVLRAAGESLGRRFVWLGAVDDEMLPDVYRAADVFCLPSSSGAETFGMSTIEAHASGSPAVTTAVGTGTSVVNLDGVTGVVVPPADPTSLRDALVQLLGDDAMRRGMGIAARQRVEREFSRDVMLDRVHDLYGRLI